MQETLIIGGQMVTANSARKGKNDKGSGQKRNTQTKGNNCNVYNSSDFDEFSESYLDFYDKPIDNPFQDFVRDDYDAMYAAKKGTSALNNGAEISGDEASMEGLDSAIGRSPLIVRSAVLRTSLTVLSLIPCVGVVVYLIYRESSPEFANKCFRLNTGVIALGILLYFAVEIVEDKFVNNSRNFSYT